MEGEFMMRGEGGHHPQLLNLIPNEKKKDWMAKDSGGGGGGGFGDAEEKKLELRLGPPGGEEWSPMEGKKREEPSVHSLGFLKPTTTNNNSNLCARAKRGLFLDTMESKTEGFQQQQGFLQLQSIAGLGKESSLQRTGGKAELQPQQQHQQSLEMKTCCPPPAAAAHAAPRNAAGASSTSHTRTASVPVVGWPPIRSFRRNLASSSSKTLLESQNKGSETGVKHDNSRKGLFVKINMEGIPIGRKVDLKAYESYEKLSSAVEELFCDFLAAQKDPPAAGIQRAEEKHVFAGLLDGSGEYTLVYEDNEGDRMLVGDLPWEMFVSTAKRLRVLKSSELSSLSLGSVSRKRTATDC